MKVAFCNPPGWDKQNADGSWRAWCRAGSRWPFTSDVQSSPDNFVWGDYAPMPFFMAYAASYARSALHGAIVLFRDSVALRESYASWMAWLAEENPHFLVVESATPSWEHDRSLLETVQARFPQLKIIITGPIVIERGTEIISSGLAIAACKGEYEKGVVRALHGERGVIEHDLLTTVEINAAPPPWLDELHAHLYCDTNPINGPWPQLQTWSSRGCPFRCVWCVWPATMTGNDPTGEGERKVRYYSEDYMTAYLTETVERFGFKSIYDDSDTFNLGTKHTEAMCRAYKATGVPWGAMCRADTIKLETWDLMYESGCRGVKIGVESGSQYVVDKIINKHLNLEEVCDVVRHLSSIGMRVHGTFSFGNPGETKEQMQETFRFILKLQRLGMTTYQTSGVAEIEGTPLSTLSKTGHLDKYPGASCGTGYRRESDGNRKMLQLVEDLRNG